MFLTALEDFDYKPYYKDGGLVRGCIQTQVADLWQCEGELPEGVSDKITIQSGFVSDLASLPWVAKLLIIKLGRHQRDAVMHDWLTRNQIGGFLWAIL